MRRYYTVMGPMYARSYNAEEGETARARTIYSPDASVSYIGNFSGANGCTQIVALTVSWSGNSTFSANCSSAGMTPVEVGSVVKLSA